MLTEEEKRPFRELAQQEKVEHAIKYPGYSYFPKGNSSKAQKSGTHKIPSSFENTIWTWTSTTASTESEVLVPEVLPNESTGSSVPAVELNSGTEVEQAEVCSISYCVIQLLIYICSARAIPP